MDYFQCSKRVFLFLPVFSNVFMNIYTGYVCILLGKNINNKKFTDLPTLFFSSLLRQHNNFFGGPNIINNLNFQVHFSSLSTKTLMLDVGQVCGIMVNEEFASVHVM